MVRESCYNRSQRRRARKLGSEAYIRREKAQIQTLPKSKTNIL